MVQSRIIEIEYHDFLKILQHATDSKTKIDIADKVRWKNFVREHKVPEAGMGVKAKAGAMSGNTKAVIIDGDGAANGYYIYSSDDLFCLKFEPGTE
jgi:hypothetical protein